MTDRLWNSLSRKLLALIISSVITVSLRLVWFNAVGYDEGIYLLTSRLFLEGTVIYRDIPIHKPPLIFVINAVLPPIGGNLLMARALIMVVSILSSLLIYCITCLIIGKFKVALLASVLFSVFSSLPISELFFVLTEPFVILFELGAFYFLVKAKATRDTRNLIFAGILASSAMLTRQTAVLFVLLSIVFLLYLKHKEHFSTKKMLLHSLLGALLPVVLVIILFGYLGALQPMIYQNTVWAYEDASKVTGFTNIRQTWFLGYFASASPLWFLGTVALVRRKDLSKVVFHSDSLAFLMLWAIIVVAFYGLLFGPGYYH